MKQVTFKQFVANVRLRKSAQQGKSFLVSDHGKPYFRVLPPEQPQTCEGAARHLSKGVAVSPEPVPREEWKGLD